VSIADEYQVTSVINKCKEYMMRWLQASFDQARAKDNHYLYQAVYLRPCLSIVAKAHELTFNDVVKFAVKIIAKFGHILYNEGQKDLQRMYDVDEIFPSDKTGDETFGDIKMDCMKMFQKLSFEIKYKIVAERLLHLNDETSLKY
jgi:hypothetical protein